MHVALNLIAIVAFLSAVILALSRPRSLHFIKAGLSFLGAAALLLMFYLT